jgi:hypothetical protein
MPDDRKHRLIDHLRRQGVDASVEIAHGGFEVKVGQGDHLLVPSTFEGSTVRVNLQMPLGRRRKKR